MGTPLTQRGGTRLAIIALGGLSLLTGLAAALSLLAVLPAADPISSIHGPLMVNGFVTTLIALERAASLRALWGFAAPLGTGIGGLLLLTPLPIAAGLAVQVAGLSILVAIYWRLWNRSPAVPVGVEWLGSVLALGAGILWLGGVSTPAVLPWIAGYLVLTIAGERLELSHVASPPPAAERSLFALAALLAVAAPLSLLTPTPGNELLALGLLGISAWIFRFDVATRLVRGTGLPRFAAANMLAGAAWLALAGAIWLLTGPLQGAATYDSVVHSVTLGYVMSMIFGHAPIIFPALIRRPLPYHGALYLPSVLLHAGLAIRVPSDLRGWGTAWQVGGVLGVAALLTFALTVVIRVTTARPSSRKTPRRTAVPRPAPRSAPALPAPPLPASESPLS